MNINTNAIRSIINGLTGGVFINIAQSLSGCTFDNPSTDIVEPMNCAGSWIPIQYQAYLGAGMIVLGLLLKMFGGSGATVAQNIAAPVVPVVPAIIAGPGTVSASQVSATAAKK